MSSSSSSTTVASIVPRLRRPLLSLVERIRLNSLCRAVFRKSLSCRCRPPLPEILWLRRPLLSIAKFGQPDAKPSPTCCNAVFWRSMTCSSSQSAEKSAPTSVTVFGRVIVRRLAQLNAKQLPTRCSAVFRRSMTCSSSQRTKKEPPISVSVAGSTTFVRLGHPPAKLCSLSHLLKKFLPTSVSVSGSATVVSRGHSAANESIN